MNTHRVFLITQKKIEMPNLFLIDSQNTNLKMHECGQNEYWFYHKDTYTINNPLLKLLKMLQMK